MDEFLITPVTNQLFTDRTMSLPPEHYIENTFDFQSTDDEELPIKVRGVPIKNIEPIRTDTFGPLKVEFFQGFRGETSTNIAGNITWNKPIEINRDITYRIHLFIDVSGSMDSRLSSSSESRIHIII